MNKRRRYCFWFIFLVCFLSACSKEVSQQPHQVVNEKKEEETLYFISEIAVLPSPEQALDELVEEIVIEEGWRYIAGSTEMYHGNLYRPLEVWDEDGYEKGIWLMSLKQPYEQWVVTQVPMNYEENGKQYKVVGRIHFLQGTPVFAMWCDDDEKYYLGSLKENGAVEVREDIPEEFAYYRLKANPDGQIYAFNKMEGELTVLDSLFQVRERKEISGRIYNVFPNPKDSDAYIYGCDENGGGIWKASNKEKIVQLENMVEEAYQMCAAPDGKIYWADREKLWRCHDTDTEILCTFSERDYVLNAIYGLEVQEDSSILLFSQIDNKYCLLQVKEDEDTEDSVWEKREIEIAFGSNHIGLQRVIAEFNRISDTFHITVRLPEENEKPLDYWNRLQMEISAGKGPDIISDEAIWDAEAYIQNGYFESLEGVLVDESEYLPAALEGSRRNGVLYGIPYDCQLFFVTYSQKLAGGREAWTLPELMEAVRNSDAEILQYGYDGVDIVEHYGLFDNENTAYIDWEQGKSHLTEEPFLELLDFAREYADTGERSQKEGEMLSLGTAAATQPIAFDNLQVMNYLDACFQGEPAMLGYPRAEGNGIYVRCRELFLNAASENKEGVTEFFQFIMSEEMQNNYIDFKAVSGQRTIGWYPEMPVHMKSFEHLVAIQRTVKENEEAPLDYGNGVSYQKRDLTDEQISQFYRLLEQAQPDNWKVLSIMSIVEEELTPYFAGTVDAADAARILDNRVQLYLDETR